MIPLKLSLRNFMSYGDAAPELDLEGLHVVCLCGDNGVGKSALLDAITWALWGSVRGMAAGTRGLRTDELVHVGQSEMEVSLEFLAGETRYRVVRKHGRAKRGPGAGGMLDLQEATGSGFRSISESSMDATQQVLTRHILRMDYETFVNTAFLLQGQTDRFTRAEPMKRKEVLGEILGLSLYERLAIRSRQQASELKVRLEQADSELQRLDQELATREAAQAEVRQAQESLEALLPQVEEAAHKAEAARMRLTLLDRSAEEERRLRQDLERRQAALQEMEHRLRRLEAQHDAYEKALAERDQVLHAEATFLEKRRQLQEADSLALRHQTLQLVLHQHQQAVEVARVRLEAEAQAAERKLADLQARASSLEKHQLALQQAEAQLAALDGEAAELQPQQDELNGVRADAQALKAKGNELLEAMKTLRERLDLLLSQPDAVCPLCGTALGQEGRAHLQQEKEAEGKELRRRYDQVQESLKQRTAQARTLAQAVEAAKEVARRQREEALRRQERAARSLEDASAAQAEMEQASRAAAELGALLASNNFAPEARQALQQARDESAALGYDQARHQRLRDEVSGLEPALEQARALREAEQRLPEVAREHASLVPQVEQAKQSLRQGEADLERLAREIMGRPRLAADEAVWSERHRELQQRHQAAQATLARCEARLQELESKAQRRSELQRDARALQDDRNTHELLADAFGRNGIPVMLVDEARPDLEADANELLARLTDGRMSLKLETLRPTRRGSTVETLELLVADELGTRAYDLFSGGEAFRVNFALRVALARLLARRAGAPLRTLLIDEGFGTQDATGRERLVEAIQAIQDDFELIIAITHLDEVKEAFPVRVEVTKTERGSAFQLVS